LKINGLAILPSSRAKQAKKVKAQDEMQSEMQSERLSMWKF